MADWTNLPDTTFEPGAPAKGRDIRFLRDNPIAIAEGAPGAPRVTNAALDGGITDNKLSTNATNTGRDWVLARMARSSAGAVGTYMLATNAGTAQTTFYTPGETLSGSSLSPASASGTNSGSMSGTWRCFGRASMSSEASDPGRTTLWLRIS